MSNMLRINMKREYEAMVFEGKIRETDGPHGLQVYACTDEISAWIGTCNDIESLEEIVGPENLIESITYSCSNEEMDVILPILRSNGLKYDFFGEIRTAIDEEA